MSSDTIQPRPLCAGYVGRLPGPNPPEEQHLVAELCAFADREGFAVDLVFIEQGWQRTLALNALTTYCQLHGIRDVIVPTSDHLNTLSMLADLSQEQLQQDIGGRVWIVTPSEEESSCPPTELGNGGSP